VLTFIGHLRTPFKTLADCPRNGRQPVPPPLCQAVVEEEFRPGLAGLEGFSHLVVLYWLDQPRSVDLVFTPPFDTQPRGVFATRAPWRPNPIGMSVVAFEGLAEPGCLNLRYLDCIDGTRLLDIKPYLRSVDSEPTATAGWLEPHLGRRGD
jgi:tRNA-Thr(GGU) m(6)t(6)A37 methyltransferase TsaA